MRSGFLSGIFKHELRTKKEIIGVLRDATQRKIIDNDSLPMIEAVINIAELKARDIMIPRNQIDVIDINDGTESIVNKIMSTGHSRFPVIDGEISSIIGIFHSKDLVAYFSKSQGFDIRNHLRKAYFVPEIKRLDNLMYEMRLNHAHIVIVVDEFTNVVGLVTLEMIIEQVIGDIEDEYDSIEGERLIVALSGGKYRVKGYCKLIDLNAKLNLSIKDSVVETVGGFIIKFLGRVPEVGEKINFSQYMIEILHADSR
ncbi:MAG: CBS domain-containing protein, partial [Burkholderiales bacterium]|nr:CBS domain-containing protein [Burkholderiales bacterium]